MPLSFIMSPTTIPSPTKSPLDRVMVFAVPSVVRVSPLSVASAN